MPVLSMPLLEELAEGPSSPVRKLFVYGGAFDRGFIKYVASLTGKKDPKICFLPTAAGDAPGYIVRWFETCAGLSVMPYVQRSFISSYSQKQSFEEVFMAMDAILVGGGNTLNLMAIWKAQGMDIALRKAYENSVVLGGGSAGSLCWFAQGTTDSRPGRLTTVEGLGLVNYSHSPTMTQKQSVSHFTCPRSKAASISLDMPATIKPEYILKTRSLSRQYLLTKRAMHIL